MKIGILFDLDGTLLDTLEDLYLSTNFALARFGYPGRTREEVRRFVGNGAGELIRRATEDGADRADVLAAFQTHYRAHCQDHTVPYAGILEALAALRQSYPLAIVSNKPDGAAKALCRTYFGEVYAQGESAECPRKPAPDMVWRAMDAVGVDGCVYVGDSEVDILTAQNAKVPCLSVLWGFRTRQELKNGYFCESPDKLENAVGKIVEEYYGK